MADIFRMHGEAYRKAYNVPWEHIKVMGDIMACRTPQMGGFIEHCDTCGFTREVYHSCGNRHCPKCQTRADPHPPPLSRERARGAQ